MLVNTLDLVILTGPRGVAVVAKLTKPQFRQLFARLDEPKANHTGIAKEFAICRRTLYGYINRRQEIQAQL